MSRRNLEKWNQQKHESYLRNREKVALATKRSRQIRREAIDSRKDIPCMDCGIKHPSYVMDFDHREGTEKKGVLSQLFVSASLGRILKEIEKCDVVCSNCHRIRTHNRLISKSSIVANAPI